MKLSKDVKVERCGTGFFIKSKHSKRDEPKGTVQLLAYEIAALHKLAFPDEYTRPETDQPVVAPPEHEVCGDCKYWLYVTDECNRYPRRPSRVSEMKACGEWQPRDS